MSSVFEKLNLKAQREILVLNSPESFEPELEMLDGVTILRDLQTVTVVHFALVFAIRKAEVDAASKALVSKAQGDAILWFAYPKGTSTNYKCEFNRDSGWDVLGRAGYEGVRMVAIDQDWSALRFRRVEYIKSLARDPSRARSEAGKARISRK